jgi:hypothetical protein
MENVIAQIYAMKSNSIPQVLGSVGISNPTIIAYVLNIEVNIIINITTLFKFSIIGLWIVSKLEAISC